VDHFGEIAADASRYFISGRRWDLGNLDRARHRNWPTGAARTNEKWDHPVVAECDEPLDLRVFGNQGWIRGLAINKPDQAPNKEAHVV
jgi:hypothetical protein